jgi:hypothetical protein
MRDLGRARKFRMNWQKAGQGGFWNCARQYSSADGSNSKAGKSGNGTALHCHFV